MAKQKYIINKQVIALKLNENKDIKELQGAFSSLYYSELLPVIEEMLDKYFGQSEETHHQINKLEIDLGKLDFESVSAQFKIEFDRLLNSLQADNYSAKEEQGVKNKTELEPQKTPLNILSYYLSSGRLPWWSPDFSKAYMEQQLETLIQRPELAFIQLLTHLYQNSNSLNRFLNSFSEELLIKCTYLIAGVASADINGLLEDVKKQVLQSGVRLNKIPAHIQVLKALLFNIFSHLPMAQQPPKTFRQMKDHYKSSTLDLLGVNQFKTADVQNKLVKSIKNLVKYYLTLNKEAETWQHFFQHLANKVSKASFLEVSEESLLKLESLLQELQSGVGNAVVRVSTNGVGKNGEADPARDAKNRLDELVRSKLSPLAEHIHYIDKEIHRAKAFDTKPGIKRESNFSDSDFISVSNAGLVLLWPFLPRFFENLSLVNEKVFVDNAARYKAACILQFICTQDETEIFEGQMSLAKVLCGIPMDEAVEMAEISAADKEIIDGLLHSIINQVPQWKNISVKGFTASYIERPASLRVRDNHWLLQVQKETYDVLLQKLPWSYHAVSLPWMENVLIVEW